MSALSSGNIHIGGGVGGLALIPGSGNILLVELLFQAMQAALSHQPGFLIPVPYSFAKAWVYSPLPPGMN